MPDGEQAWDSDLRPPILIPDIPCQTRSCLGLLAGETHLFEVYPASGCIASLPIHSMSLTIMHRRRVKAGKDMHNQEEKW